jgi:hypothetical protein
MFAVGLGIKKIFLKKYLKKVKNPRAGTIFCKPR